MLVKSPNEPLNVVRFGSWRTGCLPTISELPKRFLEVRMLFCVLFKKNLKSYASVFVCAVFLESIFILSVQR